MDDKQNIHRIYQLMGLVAPDEPFINLKINAETDPLAFLRQQNIKSSQGATGLFLIRDKPSIDNSNLSLKINYSLPKDVS